MTERIKRRPGRPRKDKPAETRFIIRLPDGVHDRLKALSKEKELSMNAIAAEALENGLNMQEELQIQIDAVKLLRRHLEAEQEARA